MPDGSTTANSTYSRAQLLEVVDKLEEQGQALVEAKKTVSSLARSLRVFRDQTVKSLGIPLDILDEAIRDAKMSGTERQRRYEHKARMMAFLDKPIGFQGSFIMPEETDEDRAAFAVHNLKAIDVAGYAAGKVGHDRHGSNTYSPGTEEHVRFDNAWLRGDGEKPANPPAPPELKRGPGRPRKTAVPVTTNGAAGEPTMSIDDMARRDGRLDASEGHDNHAGLYPQGNEGHSSYLLGRAEIDRARQGEHGTA
ncbi:MAG TPA: hypothetical protein VKS24_24775 [Bradyrhizobium sp.]|nr:hypothetical protein [Bradyrhizobium sp.]